MIKFNKISSFLFICIIILFLFLKVNSESSETCPNCIFGKCVESEYKCLCDNSYTGIDCSIPIVNITSIIATTTEGGVAIINGWFGDIHQGLALTIGGLNCEIMSITTTVIKCIAPPGNGVKPLILTQNGIEYQSPIPYTYLNVEVKCPNNCSGIDNGECNNQTGECKCNIKYTNTDCSIPNQVISSITATTVMGGVAIINGWFGNIHQGLSLTIGGLNCPIMSNTSTVIKCIAPPNNLGTYQVVLNQNGIEYQSPIQFTYSSDIELKCPNDCSGINNGECNRQTGECKCNIIYTNKDCSIPNQFILSINGSSTAGGDATFFGWFGNIHNYILISIGGEICQPILNISSTVITCNAPPGNGNHSVILIQNGIHYASPIPYTYSELSEASNNNNNHHLYKSTLLFSIILILLVFHF